MKYINLKICLLQFEHASYFDHFWLLKKPNLLKELSLSDMETQEQILLFTFTFNIMTSTLSITTKIILCILLHNYFILQQIMPHSFAYSIHFWVECDNYITM
jgi:hypothetical protein